MENLDDYKEGELYFTLGEMTASTTALFEGIDNAPKDFAVVFNLYRLVKHVLQPAREKLGIPIYVTSGYRSAALNIKVGGAYNSAHLYGLAADIVCADMQKLFEVLQEYTDYVEKVLYEHKGKKDWIHVQISRGVPVMMTAAHVYL